MRNPDGAVIEIGAAFKIIPVMNTSTSNYAIGSSPYGSATTNNITSKINGPRTWRPPHKPQYDDGEISAYYFHAQRAFTESKHTIPPMPPTEMAQEVAEVVVDNMGPGKTSASRMVLSPTAQHAITRDMLVGTPGLENFGKLILRCAAYNQQFFELANQVLSIDAKTGNIGFSDFIDFADGLAFSAMQAFFGAANPGTPRAANELDWANAVRPHMQKLLRDNLEFSHVHEQLVEERIKALKPPDFGELDRACDGILDYVRGIRLIKIELEAATVDPATKMAKLLEIESSIRVPNSAQRWQSLTTLGEFEATPFIIENLLVEATVAMIYGPPGDGKTFLALDMASSIASGRAWNGLHTERGGVLYYCLEGGTGFRNRVRALRNKGLLCDDDPFGFSTEALDLRSPAAHAVILSDIKVKELQFKMKVKLIVIDTLAVATSGGNECTSEDMGSALAASAEVVKSSGATVLLIHHPGKDVSRGPRGWSGIGGNLDTIIEMERASGGLRKANVKKQKDGEDGYTCCTFQLEIVTLGYNDRQKCVTSCTVNYLTDEEAAKAGADDPDTILRRLWSGRSEGDVLTTSIVREVLKIAGKGGSGSTRASEIMEEFERSGLVKEEPRGLKNSRRWQLTATGKEVVLHSTQCADADSQG